MVSASRSAAPIAIDLEVGPIADPFPTSLTVRSDQGKIHEPIYIILQDRLTEITDCKLDEGGRTEVDYSSLAPNARPYIIRDWMRTQPTTIWKVEPRNGRVRLSCDLDSKALWANDGKLHTLTVPYMAIVRWREGDDSASASSKDCITIDHELGGSERMEGTDPYAPPTVDKRTNVNQWRSCGEPDSLGHEADGYWYDWVIPEVRRITVTDAAEASSYDRNLLIVGATLGLAGALLVEVFSSSISLLETLVPYVKRRRPLTRAVRVLEQRWRRRTDIEQGFEQLTLW